MSLPYSTLKLPPTHPGMWVKIPYSNDRGSVYLSFDEGEHWLPAFYEDGQIMVRCPSLEPGSYTIWGKSENEVVKAATIEVK